MNCEYKVLRTYSDNYTNRSADVIATFYNEADAFYWARYQSNRFKNSKYKYILETYQKRYPVEVFPQTYKEFKEGNY